MPKQQLYAWASLGSSIAFAGLYVLFIIGIPSLSDPARDGAMEVFLWIMGLAFLVELLLDLGSGRDRIDADERDHLIAGRAFKVGFHVFTVAVVILIGHLFIADFLMSAGGTDPYDARLPGLVRHFTVLAFFSAHAAKSGTQVFLYGRGG